MGVGSSNLLAPTNLIKKGPLSLVLSGPFFIELGEICEAHRSSHRGRHKARLVQDDRYLFSRQKYIELNLVRAGMVAATGDYRLGALRSITNACLVLGNVCFKDQIATVLGRSVCPGQGGRPRKNRG